MQFEEAASRFLKKDLKLQKWKTECSKLSDELCSMKKLSPEAAPLLSDFIPFEDIPLTVTSAAAPLPVCAYFLDLSNRDALITGLPNGPVLFCWLSSVVVCNAAGGLAGRPLVRWRSGGRHCTAGQYGYVSLGRKLVSHAVIRNCFDSKSINR